jgi:hypothetical protein
VTRDFVQPIGKASSAGAAAGIDAGQAFLERYPDRFGQAFSRCRRKTAGEVMRPVILDIERHVSSKEEFVLLPPR